MSDRDYGKGLLPNFVHTIPMRCAHMAFCDTQRKVNRYTVETPDFDIIGWHGTVPEADRAAIKQLMRERYFEDLIEHMQRCQILPGEIPHGTIVNDRIYRGNGKWDDWTHENG